MPAMGPYGGSPYGGEAPVSGRIASDTIAVSDSAKLSAYTGHVSASDSLTVTDSARPAQPAQPSLYKLRPGIGAHATPRTRNPVNAPRYFKKQLPRPPPSYSFAGVDHITVVDVATRAAIAQHTSSSDVISISDKPALRFAPTDSISISDSPSAQTSGAHAADSFSVSDSAHTSSQSKGTTDTISISESGQIAYAIFLADSLTVSDVASAIVFVAGVDAIGPITDSARTSQVTDRAKDRITITDAARATPGTNFVTATDTITVSDNVHKALFASGDVISISDSAVASAVFFGGYDTISITDLATGTPGFIRAFIFQAATEVAFQPTGKAQVYQAAFEVSHAPSSKAFVYTAALEVAVWRQLALSWPENRVFFDRMASRLTVLVETGDGNSYRWAPDAWDPAYVYQNLGFSTVMPGGFEEMTLTLNRDPSRIWPDFEPFATVSVLAPGGRVVWQGRLEEFPETAGETEQVSVRAVGGQAYLDDNNSAAFIYVDQNLSNWQSPSVNRQVTLTNYLSGTPHWAAGTNYELGSIVQPNPSNGYAYNMISPATGTSGSSQPTWPTILGHTVGDHGITWNCVAPIPAPTNLTPSTGQSWQQGGTNVASDPTNFTPALIAQIDDNWASPSLALVEAWYDANDTNGIAEVYYHINYPSLGIDQAWDVLDSNWIETLTLSDDDNATKHVATTGNVFSASNKTVSGYFKPGGVYRYASIDWYSAVSGGGPGWSYWSYWRLAVYGPHGLKKYGPDPGGLLASDVIAHALQTFVPRLTFTTGLTGSIQPSTYSIQQLTFTPGPASAIIKGAVVYEMLDWAVWENFTFYLNARNGRGKKWYAQSGPAQLNSAGPQVSKIWNGVIVQFTAVDGLTYTVGPPGSGSDLETGYLLNTDPSNAANKVDLKKWAPLQMSTATFATAIQTGMIFLQESALVNTSGEASLTGFVMDDSGVWWPSWMVRAGDQISFTDSVDTSFRRIIHTDYTAQEARNTIQLDQPPDTMGALLQRLSASLAAFGLS